MTNIVLIGFMGAGKSTIGRLLADQLQRSFVDVDDFLTQKQGQTPSDIFATVGESAFREMEHDALVEILANDDQIIASGGGIVENPANQALLSGAEVIFLTAEFATILPRLLADDTRPLLQRHTTQSFYALFTARQAKYAAFATQQVWVDGKTPARVAAEILTWLQDGRTDLTALRSQIDSYDRQILALVEKRLAVATKVAQYKQAHGLAVVQAGRMATLKAALHADSALPDAVVDTVIETLFALTIAHEEDVHDGI